MKHPDTAELAKRALETSGLTHGEFAKLIHVGTRTLSHWTAGTKPASPIAQMVLREVAAGWKPSAAAEAMSA